MQKAVRWGIAALGLAAAMLALGHSVAGSDAGTKCGEKSGVTASRAS